MQGFALGQLSVRHQNFTVAHTRQHQAAALCQNEQKARHKETMMWVAAVAAHLVQVVHYVTHRMPKGANILLSASRSNAQQPAHAAAV